MITPGATVNSRTVDFGNLPPHTTALDWIRDLGFTGAKEGCAEGECGACAILVARPSTTGDNTTEWVCINACLIPAASLEGQDVLTAEGLGSPDDLHPVQREMALRGGSQCGYCTPGFVCSMAAEYYRAGRAADAHPGAADEPEHGANGFDLHAMSGNLCRCTGYRPIRDAAYALGEPAADDPIAQRHSEAAPVSPATRIASNGPLESATPPAQKNPTMNRFRRALSFSLALSAAALALGANAQNRELTVASSATYAPFAFENKDKQIVGFDIDIINAIAKQQGLKIKIVNTPFTGIFGALNNGDVDLVISGVTINEKRKQSYDFTPPYFAARQLIALPKNSTVGSLKDLAGKKIAVVSASTADDIASREFGKTNPNIRRFESTPLIISELAGGGVDAAMGDNGVIAYRVAQNPELKTLDDKSFPEEGFGIVVKKGDKALLDKLTAGLAAIRADGSYEAIYKKWFAKAPNAR